MKNFLRNKIIKRSTFNLYLNQLSDLKSLVRKAGNFQGEYLQDYWAIAECGFKTNGYFVEFGAANGKEISNTYILENQYSWNGILSEPARSFKDELLKNRKCSIDHRAVWDVSGEELKFMENKDAFLSSLHSKENANTLGEKESYLVETITLTDLLKTHSAPKIIDFCSIDVEGFEYKILKKFFSDGIYSINHIAVEHNWRADSNLLIDLFLENGYTQKYMHLSQRDYWFSRISIST